MQSSAHRTMFHERSKNDVLCWDSVVDSDVSQSQVSRKLDTRWKSATDSIPPLMGYVMV